MIINGMELWPCDPAKNTKCRKSACFLTGGPCHLTHEKEFRRMMKVKLDDGAFMPERAHPTDAGLDLRSREELMLCPGHSHSFDTGVHIEIPHGFYGKIESKSGLNVNDSVVSCGGVIDEGYTGSIAVKLYNFGRECKFFSIGDKIAQIVIQPYEAPEMEVVTELEKTARGDNGFGSTGR